jgi:hypothetical protein
VKRLLLLMLLGALGACDSPEAARVRGGAGADVGNRGPVVLMHEGSKPFAKTPALVPTQPGPAEPANQAHALSLP